MNIALVGLGMVAGTHVAAISASTRGLRLSGVLGRDPSRTEAFARQAGTRAYADLNALAADPDVDFVIVATPPDARTEIVRALIAARKPILMEKPVERTLPAAAQIVRDCASANLPLGIVFQHRARAASIVLKAAIAQGRLGDIVTAELRVPWWRDQNYYDAPGRGTYARDGGGVLINQAIHTLDLFTWLAGPISRVQAMTRTTPLHRMEAEDWAGALFETVTGVTGTLMASTAAYPGQAESITLQGRSAAAHLASGVLTISSHDGTSETFGSTDSTGGGANPMAFTHAWHQSVIEGFAQSLAAGQPPPISGQEALHTHAVIDALQSASQTGRRTKVPET